MTHEPSTVHLDDKVVIHDAYLASIGILDFSLLFLSIYADTSDHAALHLATAGDVADEERHTGHVDGIGGRIETLAKRLCRGI